MVTATTPIAELAEDRIVEGIYAVARKQRHRTRAGHPYLALELIDQSGRVDARVWNDVDLIDQRFDEGDAVRVLGRVERFRDRLQVDVRSVEPIEIDTSELVPESHRDVDELDGFFEFLAAEISHRGLRNLLGRLVGDNAFRDRLRLWPATQDGHHSWSGGLLEHTVAVATICREAAQLQPRLRGDLVVSAALLHDVGRTVELAAPLFTPTAEGKLLGHVHLGLRFIEARAERLEEDVRVELLHAVASHHDSRAARTAEAAVLYHANQLDTVATTRPVETAP